MANGSDATIGIPGRLKSIAPRVCSRYSALKCGGNADLAMRQAWNALTWAFAEAGTGLVQTPGGALTPTGFRAQAEMPAGLEGA